uniref:hypothetical protein n=1 Tax=Psychrobacter sp. TaxID=56811 RepID=UPI0015EE5F0C|nr:hypothetical protein [Psychrobacter sp.]
MKLLKKSTLAVVVALASTASLAAYDCKYMKDIAYGTNHNRQYSNFTIEQALEINIVSRDLSIGHVEDGNSDQSYRDILSDYDLSNSIVREVYKMPMYKTEEGRKLSIEYFAEAVYRNCMNGNYD